MKNELSKRRLVFQNMFVYKIKRFSSICKLKGVLNLIILCLLNLEIKKIVLSHNKKLF